jgi:uncharacterized protein YecT (DUF1311 family)
VIASILLLIAQASPADDAAAVALEAATAAAKRGAKPGAEPDIDCSNARTQMEMNVCSFRDFEAADALLNREWQLASDRAKESDRWSAEHHSSGGEFDRLLDAQRKWLEFRDAQCLSEVGPREGRGSIWPLLQNGCLRQLTEARIAQLRELNEPSN